MTLAIDAILIFAAVLCIWAGARKGFVRSVMGLFSSLIAAVAAYAYTPVLSAFIRERYLTDRITDGIDETLRSLAFDTSTDLFSDLSAGVGRSFPEAPGRGTLSNSVVK